jgi:hypothetical protein
MGGERCGGYDKNSNKRSPHRVYCKTLSRLHILHRRVRVRARIVYYARTHVNARKKKKKSCTYAGVRSVVVALECRHAHVHGAHVHVVRVRERLK